LRAKEHVQARINELVEDGNIKKSRFSKLEEILVQLEEYEKEFEKLQGSFCFNCL